MSEVLDVKGRIKTLLREHRVTENQLSNDGPFSQKVLNNQISHKATLTVEMLLFILDRFPDVSAEWLMRGKETTTEPTTASDTEAVRGLLAQLAEKDRQLAEKDKQIGQLLQIIAQRPAQ